MKEKKCAKCNEIKPLDDFEENQFSPDGRYLICRACFAQRLKKPAPRPEPEKQLRKPKKSAISAPPAGTEKKAPQPKPPPRAVSPVSRKTVSIPPEIPAEEIRKAQLAVLSDADDVSTKTRAQLPKLRKCNGCKKVEAVGKTPAVPPRPVQAWFCEECIKSKKHQYVGKGYLVYDYWGRIYKVTRAQNTEVVQGVVKKGNGSWSTRKFDIHGYWQTKKPLK